jgi:hypothetical protein
MTHPVRLAIFVGLFAAASLLLSGCKREGCLAGGAGCEVPSPCDDLAFDCEGGSASLSFIDEAMVVAGSRPGGLQAQGAIGDIVLGNEYVQAVIEHLDHRNLLGPTGGNLLDLVTTGDGNDGLNHMMVATGILPGDAVYYERMEILSTGPDVAAVQFLGRLAGHQDVRVNTRYELRSCDRGLRVRTEMINLGTEPALWPIYDAFYWGRRQVHPFIPVAGTGFDHPGLDLENFDDIATEFPFMAAPNHTAAPISYAVTGCNTETIHGINADILSAVGLARRIVPPRDYRIYERFVAAGSGNDVAASADIIAEVRSQLHGEGYVTVSGRVLYDDGVPAGGDPGRVSVHLVENGPAEAAATWSQVTPRADGTFSARVPAERSYRVDAWAFGRVVSSADVEAGEADVAAGDLAIPRPATVDLTVLVDGAPADAQVFFHPADEAAREALTGRVNGVLDDCAPLLGSPTGPSPACNRVLVHAGGPTSVQAPAGRYHLYATVGPFATLAREAIELIPGDAAEVSFELSRLPLVPEGALSADLHVHGGRSFDSSFPEYDRVLSFLAASVDVIAATDHDIVHDYAEGIAALNAENRLRLMPGVETTGLILFLDIPTSSVPKVVGHFNFWPLQVRPGEQREGSPWSQLAEPGEIFERMAPHYTGTPVIQLNHPWREGTGGRDYGFPRAVQHEVTRPLPDTDDGTSGAILTRVPECGPEPAMGCEAVQTPNDAYHVQEVMNGTTNRAFLQQRAFWFYLLDLGVVRAGTANSDSHTLVDNVIGTPRNLVYTSTTVADFDVDVFNASVREGRMIGTNGPVIEVSMAAADGSLRTPSTEAFVPAEDASLQIRLSAAPWVPIDEIRVYVNGDLARTITDGITEPEDPFGTGELLRYEGSIPLADLLPSGGRDAYIVVEAGHPLPLAGDLNHDGIPETGDNDGDGEVTLDDVDPDKQDGCFLCEEPGRESESVCRGGRAGSNPDSCGPQPNPPVPAIGERGYPFQAVTPGGYPLAFTNPLLLDVDADGTWSGPGLPEGGE